MATRTNRLMGKVWGDPANPATVVVNYNGQEVFCKLLKIARDICIRDSAECKLGAVQDSAE